MTHMATGRQIVDSDGKSCLELAALGTAQRAPKEVPQHQKLSVSCRILGSTASLLNRQTRFPKTASYLAAPHM